MIKIFDKLGIEGNFLQLTASTKNPTTNITHNGKTLKVFSLLGTRQGYLLLSLLCDIVLEVLAREIRQEKTPQV